jgi:hypothetical protein
VSPLLSLNTSAHSSQLRLIPYLHHTSSVLRQLPLELLSEIFNEGGIKIISLSNIRPIIIYYHSSQCRLIPYLHQRPIFFKANAIHLSIVAILELIRGAQCLIEVVGSSGEEMWRVDAYQIPYYSRGIEEAKRTHPRFADCTSAVIRYLICVYASHFFAGRPYHFNQTLRSANKL